MSKTSKANLFDCDKERWDLIVISHGDQSPESLPVDQESSHQQPAYADATTKVPTSPNAKTKYSSSLRVPG
jgi:hypothetical protein